MQEPGYAMTEAEIAAELGVSEEAVKMTLRRALAKLRARPALCAGLRAAVEEMRHAQDARWTSPMLSERIH